MAFNNIMQILLEKYCLFKLLFILTCFRQIVGLNLPDFCPSFCKCDTYNGRNRADCSFKRLINPAVEVGELVEILDLSYNDITYVDNTCFQNYHFIVKLSLAHNAIHILYLDAFQNMDAIVDIDLSYNRLEYFDERLIETNLFMTTFNLEGNRFMTLKNKPFLRSKSLRELNLRNSQINYIQMESFSALPKLQKLDISQNLLITLNIHTFNAAQNLQSIHLSENRWSCDSNFFEVVNKLRHRNINVISNDCDIDQDIALSKPIENSNRSERFERISLPHHEENDSREELYDTTTAVTWRYLTRETQNNFPATLSYDNFDSHEDDKLRLPTSFDNIDECNKTLQLVYEEKKNCQYIMEDLLKKYLNMKRSPIIEYTVNDISIALLIGAFGGILLMIVILGMMICLKGIFNGWNRKQRTSRRLSPTYQSAETFDEVTINTPVSASPPPPPPPRRRPRRSNRTSHVVVGPVYAPRNDNFIGRLFGRPARIQYYRTINQNTATLIRRLSRSNLFNMRQNSSTDRTTPSSPNENEDTRFDYNYEATTSRGHDRSATPPPSYNDIVVNVK